MQPKRDTFRISFLTRPILLNPQRNQGTINGRLFINHQFVLATTVSFCLNVLLFLKMGQPWPLFVYFRSFSNTNYTEKTVWVRRIQTRIVQIDHHHGPNVLFWKMGQPGLFCLFSFFSNTNFTEKLYELGGFELGSYKQKVSMLTTWPPRPLRTVC